MNDGATHAGGGGASDVQTIDVAPVNRRETRSLYKKRAKIHPKRADGSFRALKWWIMGATLAIYYVTPWLRWDRGAGAPDQAVLIDFPSRRFYFFFIEIWPQEVYYISGLLIMAGIGLFFTTSLVGRAWCGYSCPQTVWTDLFVAVERLIEGDRGARIRLDRAKMSPAKAAKRLGKYAIWIAIAMGTGGAWVFYFADAPTLAAELARFEAPAEAYITIGILTATTFVLGGFMREQVCTYMCPWPRIMGAMMDEDSLVVTYRAWRGEPRGPYKRGASWDGRGDCVACNQCVAVCPMGIDIRDGLQLECITCALCIDACDGVMAKVGRPTGLIAYATLANEARLAQGLPSKVRIVRPRVAIYFALFALVGCIMLYVLLTRADLDVSVLHDRNPLFVTLSDGGIRNGYTFKVLNKARDWRTVVLSVEGVPEARLSVIGASAGDEGQPRLTVAPDQLQSFRVFVALPRSAVAGESMPLAFVARDADGAAEARYDSIFRGPGK